MITKFQLTSFKTKLTVFLAVFLAIVDTIAGIYIWKEMSFMIREISRNKLITIASTTASMIDAEKHEKILTAQDEDSTDYTQIQEVLQKIIAANPDVDDIYTLRKTNQDNIWSFVVAGRNTEDENRNGIIEDWEKRVEVGEQYDVTNLPEMKKAFDSPSADYETSCDSWGCWLSGYAPIKNRDGVSVAAVGVDISAQNIIDFERKAGAVIITMICLMAIVFPIVLYVFLIILLRPITAIVSGLENFRSDLSSRININRQDEFGLIASTFNSMAGRLQELYENLEDKVRQKTRQLNIKVKELEEKKAKDEALLSNIGEGIIAADEKGRIIMINYQAEKMLKADSNRIIGQDVIEKMKLENEKGISVSKDNHPITKAGLAIFRTVFNGNLIRKDMTKLPIVLTSSPVVFSGKPIGNITVFRDTTKEREIDRAKTEFVSLASHQLKTPLTSINWHAELLLDGNVGRLGLKQKKFISKINTASHRMTELVNALLNVSRIEMGTFIIEPEDIMVENLLQSALEEFQPAIAKKNLHINLNPTNCSKKYKADPKLLHIIFQNLISNAVKYTPDDGEIRLSFDEDEKHLIFTIADNGYGIPENQKEMIFTKLFRADNIKGKETDGTGLGLYIVKSIVEKSGGVIKFESKINEGSTFKIFLPREGMIRKTGSKELNI